jgi:hypothetical protein
MSIIDYRNNCRWAENMKREIWLILISSNLFKILELRIPVYLKIGYDNSAFDILLTY